MPRRGRIVIGLNSGTSADGVDAAACEIVGCGLGMRVRLLGHIHRAYPETLQRRILAVMAPASTTTEEICRLEMEVGAAFARAAGSLTRKLRLNRVDLVGTHGQTVCHLPPVPIRRADARADRVSGTMQIGDAATIGAAIRCPVVHGFRQADMAVGGQGAPLVPWTDYLLFRHAKRSRVIQNIGGVANLTWLPAGGGIQEVLAFDTGPGNMMIDELVRRATAGRDQFDRGGRRAAAGKPHPGLMRQLLGHPFLDRHPPKSCGREDFGGRWLDALHRRNSKSRIKPRDWIATATHFSAACMIIGYAQLSDMLRIGFPPMDELILCGGGARNRTLVGQLARCFSAGTSPVAVTRTDDHGIPAQAKEAISFAMLAAARADGVPANLPQVTGARRPVVLGQLCDLEARR